MVCILDSTVMPDTQNAVLKTGGFPSQWETKSELMYVFQYSLATFTFIFWGEGGDFISTCKSVGGPELVAMPVYVLLSWIFNSVFKTKQITERQRVDISTGNCCIKCRGCVVHYHKDVLNM
jgi:hypothetical protein